MHGFIATYWQEQVMPGLQGFIRIPNVSPLFDPEWANNGLLRQAVRHVANWMDAQNLDGLRTEIVELTGRTPLLFAELDGTGTQTVFFYGHLDKQPPVTGWSDGLGPYTPVVRDGKLYGRGVVDDGYNIFACIAALKALQDAGHALPHCVFFFDTCEESNSPDVPTYLDHVAERIGTPDLVVCLDSGCGDYDRLWVTTTLRGSVTGHLRVDILEAEAHSGLASGIVPSSFRIMRHLLDRIEDAATGAILPAAFQPDIPEERRREARHTATVLGAGLEGLFSWVPGARAVSDDRTELMLNQTWHPALAVTGQAGIPPIDEAGNIIRPFTALRLSLRLPPTCDAARAETELKTLLESNPPYGAHVTFETKGSNQGWNAPPLSDTLHRALIAASQRHFGKPPCFLGIGGGIPMIDLLGRYFPRAQFLVTGVGGPGSNAHGPDESLDLTAVQRLTACIADVLAALPGG